MSSVSAAEKEAAELQNLTNVKTLVRRSENPNPIILVLIIIGVMMVMGAVYIMYVKKSISGIWHDAEGNSHVILHNKWINTIVVDDTYNGTTAGHLVVINKNEEILTGLLVNNQIQWGDGSSWYCVFGK